MATDLPAPERATVTAYDPETLECHFVLDSGERVSLMMAASCPHLLPSPGDVYVITRMDGRFLAADREVDNANESPAQREIERCQARAERLREENEQLRRELSKTLTELGIYKRRCYPTGADVLAAGITVETLERWLDDHLEVGDEVMPGQAAPAWSTDGGEDELIPEWREPGANVAKCMATAIGWCADMLSLDQWDLLTELANQQPGGRCVHDDPAPPWYAKRPALESAAQTGVRVTVVGDTAVISGPIGTQKDGDA